MFIFALENQPLSLLFPVRYWRNIKGVYLFLCATKKGVKYRIYCRTYDNLKKCPRLGTPQGNPDIFVFNGPGFFSSHRFDRKCKVKK